MPIPIKKEYYLNSVASPIYINPGIWISKDYLLSLFFKDFENHEMEVIRHGKYKSAVEPFLKMK
jgi:protease-4